MLIEMHKDREYLHMNYITMKSLPKIGYIAVMNKQPIAAGFLRRVEGGYAQLDTLVSNPYFGSQIRHVGIKLVVDSLLAEAKDLKLLGIVSFSQDTGILSRAKALGFQVVDQTLICLRL